MKTSSVLFMCQVSSATYALWWKYNVTFEQPIYKQKRTTLVCLSTNVQHATSEIVLMTPHPLLLPIFMALGSRFDIFSPYNLS